MVWTFDVKKIRDIDIRLSNPIKKFVVTMEVTREVQVVVKAVDKGMASSIAEDMARMENHHETKYESPHDTGEKTFSLKESIYDAASTADCLRGETQQVWEVK